MSDRVIEINGERYIRSDVDYQKQIDAVCRMLGDDMFKALKEADAIIAGGALISAFTHKDINDIDVYFRSKEQMAEAFVRVTENWDSVYLGHTDKSITLKDRETDTIIQFIYFDYFDTPDSIFEAFDFTICMSAIEPKDLSFACSKDFISDIASRTIHFNPGTRFPYISLLRTKKYQERGYKIGRGNLLAIANACAQLPIQNWAQAKYQLGGVYGNEITIAQEEDKPFSPKLLHELLTELKENSSVRYSNYNEIYKELTGKEYAR